VRDLATRLRRARSGMTTRNVAASLLEGARPTEAHLPNHLPPETIESRLDMPGATLVADRSAGLLRAEAEVSK
jgi:hypothetical protein